MLDGFSDAEIRQSAEDLVNQGFLVAFAKLCLVREMWNVAVGWGVNSQMPILREEWATG